MKMKFTSLALAATLVLPSLASAHSVLFDCFDNADGTILCQGGFSDGSSASGVKVIVKDASGAVISTVSLDENSEITMDKPEGDYTVEMSAGEGHSVVVKSENIVE